MIRQMVELRFSVLDALSIGKVTRGREKVRKKIWRIEQHGLSLRCDAKARELIEA